MPVDRMSHIGPSLLLQCRMHLLQLKLRQYIVQEDLWCYRKSVIQSLRK